MTVTATFTVTLSHAWADPASVNYTTVAGTAVAPTNFTSQTGMVSFAPGETSKTIVVPVFPAEVAKTFSIVLSDPIRCVIDDGTGLATIPAEGDGPIVTVNGPLIKNGLIANAFHSEVGRGGYFAPPSGTSEGQSVAIYAAFRAYETLIGGTTEEQAAANYYRSLAYEMLDALHNSANPYEGAMLRQPIPTDPNTITLLHWLFAAKGDINAQGINYAYATTKTSGKLVIPATVVGHKGGADVFRVYQIYPQSSYLLYNNPWSPSYDSTSPVSDTSIAITDSDWVKVGSTVEITIPAGAPSGITAWNVIYGYDNSGVVIQQGEAQEAYPAWTKIADGYAACAPDTFMWFELALSKAIEHDARSGMATQWTNLRAASRRTAVRGQNVSDLREVFRPLPGFAVIPTSGEPSGMFCFSTHPSATPPPSEVIAAGGNSAWIGYNFWSRDSNGDVLGTVPSGTGQVQLGRGMNDSWRTSTSYQDPDQYLYVSVAINKTFTTGEKLYVYVSSTKFYSAETRWYADITEYGGLTTQTGTNVAQLLIPRTDFKRKDGDNAVLPAGTRFENFGISIEGAGPYVVRLRDLRLVSGPSTSWVTSNFTRSIKGSQTPFFPGAHPFAINADVINQQFVGWNGSPFHGYQLAALWYWLGADAVAVHGTIDPSISLPVADKDGVVSFPITTTNVNTTAKSANAMLCEQQLLFLDAAQKRYQEDASAATPGPFAHTFVVNTPARISLGNPTPHTWVYTNDDPNTRWTGYAARVAENLSYLAFNTGSDPTFGDARALAITLATNWLTAVDVIWPNLDGKVVGDGLVYGPPTDFPDPRISAPLTDYEEPHFAALILRACLYLKMADATKATLCNALIVRAWDYLEMIYAGVPTSSAMRGTWSTDPANELWYGFHEFEILTTLAAMASHSGSLPAEIDVATVRQRMVETGSWLENTGVE